MLLNTLQSVIKYSSHADVEEIWKKRERYALSRPRHSASELSRDLHPITSILGRVLESVHRWSKLSWVKALLKHNHISRQIGTYRTEIGDICSVYQVR